MLYVVSYILGAFTGAVVIVFIRKVRINAMTARINALRETVELLSSRFKRTDNDANSDFSDKVDAGIMNGIVYVLEHSKAED